MEQDRDVMEGSTQDGCSFCLAPHLDSAFHFLEAAQPDVDWAVPQVRLGIVCVTPNPEQDQFA